MLHIKKYLIKIYNIIMFLKNFFNNIFFFFEILIVYKNYLWQFILHISPFIPYLNYIKKIYYSIYNFIDLVLKFIVFKTWHKVTFIEDLYEGFLEVFILHTLVWKIFKNINQYFLLIFDKNNFLNYNFVFTLLSNLLSVLSFFKNFLSVFLFWTNSKCVKNLKKFRIKNDKNNNFYLYLNIFLKENFYIFIKNFGFLEQGIVDIYLTWQHLFFLISRYSSKDKSNIIQILIHKKSKYRFDLEHNLLEKYDYKDDDDLHKDY